MTSSGIVSPQQSASPDTAEARGDAYRKQGLVDQAIRSYLEAVTPFPWLKRVMTTRPG